jgi:RND family efflux transporter MFP subunit
MGAIGWQAWGRGDAAADPAAGLMAAPTPAGGGRALELAAIEIERVAPRRLAQTVRLSGSIEPVNRAEVRSEVAARLVEVLVREGEAVRRGEVLARFETVELAARLAEKESNLEGARAQLAYAAKTREKTVALARRDVVSGSSLDQSQSDFEVRQAEVGALEAQVRLARKALADATVTSPIDGIVAERLVHPGETPGTGASLFSVVDLSTVEVRATVPADAVARLAPGQPVRLRVDGYGERAFAGTLARINPAALAGSRAIPVHVAVGNPDGALRGGMFASGEAIVAETEAALAVPAAALRRDEAGGFVLVVAGGLTERRGVERVRAWAGGDLVEVAGLRPGEVVVTAPLPGLRAGARVALPPG